MPMRIPGYERQVGLQPLPNTRIEQRNTNTSPEAYGAGVGRAMEGLAGVLDQANVAYQKQMEDKMATDVVAAQTEYQRRIQETLYNPEGGLLTRQGKNAESVHKDFTDIEKKIREEVTKNLPQYEKAHLAFNSFADNKAMTGLGIVKQYQIAQMDNYHWQTVDNSFNQNRIDAAKNYNNLGIINAGIARIDDITAAMVTSKRGEEYGKTSAIQEKGKLLAEAIETAMANGDDASAQAILDAYGDIADPSFINKYRATLLERTKEEVITQKSDDIYSMFEDNISAALDYIEKHDTISSNSANPIESLKKSFGIQESGNNYGARNSSSGASGKYQIMPENWPKWSQEAGLGKNAHQTPENQEKVTTYKMTQYWNKYKDPYLVAVAWYAGPGRADTLQKGGGDTAFQKEYGFSIYQKLKNGPSIDSYAKSVSGMFNKFNKGTSIKVDYETKEKLINNYLQKINLKESIRNKQKQEARQNGLEEMQSLYESGVTDPKLYQAVAKKYGKDPEIFQSLLGDANWYGNANTKEMPWEAEVYLWYELQKGTNLNYDQFIEKVKMLGGDPEKLKYFSKEFINKTLRKKAPDDGYKYNWSGLEKSFLDGNKLNPNKKPQDQLKLLGGIKYAKEKIDEFKKQHNGKSPSEAQVMQWMDESLTVAIPGTPGGWFGWGKGPDTTKGQLVLNNILPNVKLSKDGSTILITMKDGTKQKMSRADFAKLMKNQR